MQMAQRAREAIARMALYGQWAGFEAAEDQTQNVRTERRYEQEALRRKVEWTRIG